VFYKLDSLHTGYSNRTHQILKHIRLHVAFKICYLHHENGLYWTWSVVFHAQIVKVIFFYKMLTNLWMANGPIDHKQGKLFMCFKKRFSYHVTRFPTLVFITTPIFLIRISLVLLTMHVILLCSLQQCNHCYRSMQLLEPTDDRYCTYNEWMIKKWMYITVDKLL
jgi:hypothetical protein